MGEGRISDVLCLAREKHWLRGNTKISELLSQALAASRYVARAEGTYEGNLDGSDDDLSGEDEDDPELMSLTEDAGGIRELAISDWARNRILDGHWLSPADQWYELSIPGQPTVVRAQHPCPWLGVTYSGALVDGESGGDGEELEHPRPRTSNASCPPTYGLCDHVYRVFQRVMREILLPAMSNIVRRIMVESSADGIDPIAQVKKMSLSDVVAELRDQATWMKGVDWLERRSLRERVERHRRANHEEDDSTSSSRSDNSHTTSPVLSTSTLQTTPSPPPCGKLDESATSPTIAAIMDIPRSPTVLAKELLRPIPYIPEAVSHLPHYSTECLSTVWREACAPLYQCRCSICERAILRVNMETDKVINAAQEQQYPQTQYSVPQNRTLVQKPVQIHIEQVPEIIARREEEEEEEDPDAEYDDEGESETEYFDLSPWESIVDVTPPSVVNGKGPEHIPVTPTRKRSHEEIQEVPDDNLDMLLGVQTRSKGATTPPKRARLEGSFSVSPSKEPIPSPSPGRLRKRSSAEIEDVEAISKEQSPKRLKSAFTDDTGRVKRVEAVR
ncbi:hypothetical protein EW026_g6317 [Hermanssonia centrifuga]|uniref:Uncharacterized protein n=1 Tax=Hermanssonia centrifuga TaxID=98765 RepID=A0A4S4KD59_9APHY|nr:hypothetical protein EW026_g6317 [Hermanssonia centrifuga]